MKDEVWRLMEENVREYFCDFRVEKNLLNKILKNYIFYILGLTIWILMINIMDKVNRWLIGGKNVILKLIRDKNLKYVKNFYKLLRKW